MLNSQKLMFLIFFLLFSTIVFAESPAAITQGIALKDCKCRKALFEDEWVVSVKKGELIEDTCEKINQTVTCTVVNSPGGTTCPASCVLLKKQAPLGLDDWKRVLKDPVTLKMRDLYSKNVPKPILEKLQALHPELIPAVYSELSPFVIDLKSVNSFYFEFLEKVDGVEKMISIVFYFPNLDHLIRREWKWSFWLTGTAEILHESTVPYPIFADGSVSIPCIAPAGRNLDKVVLSGRTASSGDSGGCCGPYVLDKLKSLGPVLVKDDSDPINFSSDVIYNSCSQKIDDKMFLSIKGLANLHEKLHYPTLLPGESKIIGSCADKARAIDLGRDGDWVVVFCEGKRGWTHKKNLRP